MVVRGALHTHGILNGFPTGSSLELTVIVGENLITMLLLLLLLFLTFSALVANPKKTTGTLHGGQSRSWSAEQGKKRKRKSLAAHPPSPPPRAARSEKKLKKKKKKKLENHAAHPHV